MTQHEDATFLGNHPCPCGESKDAFGVWSSGWGHCFKCEKNIKVDPETAEAQSSAQSSAPQDPSLITDGEIKALSARGISEATCRKFGYRQGTLDNQGVHIASYYRDGRVVAQKLRFAGKKFSLRGDTKNLPLFGMHLWNSGKMIVITEGEIDALSVSEIQDNKWPVVSVPQGAQSAPKAIARHLDYLAQFERVVLMFDMDDPGTEAAKEAAALLPIGRAYIASLPLKDANEMLLAGRGSEVVKAIWNARPYRPDGIVAGIDLWDELSQDTSAPSIPYPWTKLNEITLGQRRGELVLWTAGSGVGKSALTREIEYDLLMREETVGVMRLEENKKGTAKRLIGLHLNQPIHLDTRPWTELNESELAARKEAYAATVGSGRYYLYDHFGSTDLDNLVAKLRYMAKGLGCGWIVLDHVSIVVSGLEDNSDERKTIDLIMTRLRTEVVEQTGVGLHVVSHLKRPSGDRGHEEGAQTSLSQLRGSHALAQLSDIVIGAERNQQDEESGDQTLLRVLKNRFTGVTGPAGYLRYNRETGRLSEFIPEMARDTSPFDRTTGEVNEDF